MKIEKGKTYRANYDIELHPYQPDMWEEIRPDENEIQVNDYLDAKEDRIKALKVLRNKMFNLTIDYIEYSTCDHPAHMKECNEKVHKLWEEMIWRWQDYQVFMYDFQQDWDLNYQDYGLDKEYTKD